MHYETVTFKDAKKILDSEPSSLKEKIIGHTLCRIRGHRCHIVYPGSKYNRPYCMYCGRRVKDDF
jgi:hypothetical protein